jgi:hypothetical protein
MRHPVLKSVGYLLSAATVVGLAMTLILAVRSDKPFYGVNYMELPLGTYSTVAVLIAGVAIGIVRIVQWSAKRARERSSAMKER